MVPSALEPGSSFSPELGALAEAVLEDHADLDRLIHRIRALADALRDGRAAVEDDTVGLIGDFVSEVVAHFAAEEAEEFFGSLTTDDEELLETVDRLQTEHVEMAAVLDEIAESVLGKRPAAELADRIQRFLDQFDAHEEAENWLMREFLRLTEAAGE